MVAETASERNGIMWILIVIGIAMVVYKLIKEACEPHIPAENWRNAEKIRKDTRVNQISTKEFQKNLRNGKYR